VTVMSASIRPLFLTALGLGVITYTEAVRLTRHCQRQIDAQRCLPLPRSLIPAADKILLLEQDASETRH